MDVAKFATPEGFAELLQRLSEHQADAIKQILGAGGTAKGDVTRMGTAMLKKKVFKRQLPDRLVQALFTGFTEWRKEHDAKDLDLFALIEEEEATSPRKRKTDSDEDDDEDKGDPKSKHAGRGRSKSRASRVRGSKSRRTSAGSIFSDSDGDAQDDDTMSVDTMKYMKKGNSHSSDGTSRKFGTGSNKKKMEPERKSFLRDIKQAISDVDLAMVKKKGVDSIFFGGSLAAMRAEYPGAYDKLYNAIAKSHPELATTQEGKAEIKKELKGHYQSRALSVATWRLRRLSARDDMCAEVQTLHGCVNNDPRWNEFLKDANDTGHRLPVKLKVKDLDHLKKLRQEEIDAKDDAAKVAANPDKRAPPDTVDGTPTSPKRQKVVSMHRRHAHHRHRHSLSLSL